MKIESINIKNFKGLKSVEEKIEGKNVYLIGGNGTGKSSFIDAVWVGLTGKNIPPEPTTNGAKKGQIEIDLGDFIARTKFTKGKPTRFELENKEFTKESERFIKSPRSFMESKIGLINFDIDEFFSKSDAEKLKYMSKIMDVDFSHLDADIEEIMEGRRFDKKKLAEIEAGINYYDEELANKDLVDVVKLSKEIAAAKDKKTDYENVLEGIEKRRVSVAEKEALIKQLTNELEGYKDEDGNMVKGLFQQIDDGEKWLESKENKPLTEEALEDLTKQLDTVNETNTKIQEAKKAQEAETEAAKYRKLIENYNSDLEEKREEKAQLIAKSINVPGLVYDVNAEQFLYEGLPFDKQQQNTAAQLIAGMRIASTMLKELRILKVDASLIDSENFEKVLKWSTENDIELFVELVNRESTHLQIHVTDE